MNFTTVLIVLSLVLVGACFFGYPLGWAIGRWQMRREFENEYFVYPLPDSIKNGKASDLDILNAEIVEYETEIEK